MKLYNKNRAVKSNIAVVIPCFSKLLEFEHVLKSLAMQSDKDFLLYIVDNSTGGFFYELYKKHISCFTKVFYLRYEKQGKTGALNFALSKIDANYVAFVDEDNVLDPEWMFSIKLDIQNYKPSIIIGSVYPYYHHLKTTTIYIWDAYRFFSFPADPQNFAVGCNMIFSVDVFKKIGFFDPMLGPGAPGKAAEDTEILYRAIKSGFTVLCSPNIRNYHLHYVLDQNNAKIYKIYNYSYAFFCSKYILQRDPFAFRLFFNRISKNRKFLFSLFCGFLSGCYYYKLQKFITGSAL